MRNLVFLLLIFSCVVQAGVVIGGTRFIFAENKKSLSVTVKNRSPETWLISSKISAGNSWPGNENAISRDIPFAVTPPLFALHGERENSLRLVQTGDNLPNDRESLFTLSIAAIPSGKTQADSVQMAVRSSLKLFYRPSGLPGDPEQAYKALVWQQTAGGLRVENKTPYYVTLFQLRVNGKTIDNPGVVAPFSTRQTDWCKGNARCPLFWQSINDYGRVMPVVTTPSLLK